MSWCPWCRELFKHAVIKFCNMRQGLNSNNHDWFIFDISNINDASNIPVTTSIKVYTRITGKAQVHDYTINCYHTKCSLLVNGSKIFKFVRRDLPSLYKIVTAITTSSGIDVNDCNTKLKEILQSIKTQTVCNQDQSSDTQPKSILCPKCKEWCLESSTVCEYGNHWIHDRCDKLTAKQRRLLSEPASYYECGLCIDSKCGKVLLPSKDSQAIQQRRALINSQRLDIFNRKTQSGNTLVAKEQQNLIGISTSDLEEAEIEIEVCEVCELPFDEASSINCKVCFGSCHMLCEGLDSLTDEYTCVTCRLLDLRFDDVNKSCSGSVLKDHTMDKCVGIQASKPVNIPKSNTQIHHNNEASVLCSINKYNKGAKDSTLMDSSDSHGSSPLPVAMASDQNTKASSEQMHEIDSSKFQNCGVQTCRAGSVEADLGSCEQQSPSISKLTKKMRDDEKKRKDLEDKLKKFEAASRDSIMEKSATKSYIKDLESKLNKRDESIELLRMRILTLEEAKEVTQSVSADVRCNTTVSSAQERLLSLEVKLLESRLQQQELAHETRVRLLEDKLSRLEQQQADRITHPCNPFLGGYVYQHPSFIGGRHDMFQPCPPSFPVYPVPISDYSRLYTGQSYLLRNQMPVSHIPSGRKHNVSNHPNHVTRGCHQVHQQDPGRNSVPHVHANNTNVHHTESAMDINVRESSRSSVNSTVNLTKTANVTQNTLPQSSRIQNKEIVPESLNRSVINMTSPESPGASVYKLSPSRSTINRLVSDSQSDILLPSSSEASTQHFLSKDQVSPNVRWKQLEMLNLSGPQSLTCYPAYKSPTN